MGEQENVRIWIRERTTWLAECVWADVGKRVAEGVRSVYVDCTWLYEWMKGMRGRMWGEWRMREDGKCGKRIEGEDEMWEMEMNGMGYWGWDEGE